MDEKALQSKPSMKAQDRDSSEYSCKDPDVDTPDLNYTAYYLGYLDISMTHLARYAL